MQPTSPLELVTTRVRDDDFVIEVAHKNDSQPQVPTSVVRVVPLSGSSDVWLPIAPVVEGVSGVIARPFRFYFSSYSGIHRLLDTCRGKEGNCEVQSLVLQPPALILPGGPKRWPYLRSIVATQAYTRHYHNRAQE